MSTITVGLISLGCDKNRVDSEVMLAKLTEYGFTLMADPSKCDVIVVNTCAFLESARKEAIDTIIEMAAYKTSGQCRLLVVTGCLAQKYSAELYEHLTEADVIVGINDYDTLADTINKHLAESPARAMCVTPNSKQITAGKRILTTSRHYAYLKIADGCDNFCSYCLIPYIRGRFRSRSMEDIVAEARALADGGVKEIILVAQDVTKYGTDLYGSSAIVPLVQQLSKIDGIRWIRLLYCYPELVTDALVDEIATNDKVVKYIDIPLQHVDDRILRAMNRRSNSADINALFEKLQQKNIAARTTFICGFPSETAETHKAVVEFLQKFRLKNAGFFAYSREEGTAAYNLPAQVPAATKNKYVKNLYAVQHKVVEDNNLADVGTTQQVLIDELVEQTADGFVYIARNQYMCPEIDGMVYVHSQTALEIGEFYSCRITDALEYDLVGDKI